MFDRIQLPLALALAMLAQAFVPAQGALAQIIQLGGSDAETKAILMARGFDRIDIVDRGLSSTTYQACRGTDRVQFKVYWDGRIGNPDRIGGCRPLVSAADAERILAERGYERISLEDRGGQFIAVACRRGERVRVTVSPHGDVAEERVLGRCEPFLLPADITARLEAEGYDRISFQDRQLPRYVALACRGQDRFELVLDRFGRIAERRRVGECERPVDPYDLPALLARRGIERAVVTDPRPPRYRAEGCRGQSKVDVTVSRFGEILHELVIGRCQSPVSADQLAAVLRRQGYSNVRVTDNGANGFIAVVCMQDRRSELILNRYGEVLREVPLGRCSSFTVQEVISNLSGEEMRDITVYAEGCRRGRRIRVEINEYGEPVGRERIGPC